MKTNRHEKKSMVKDAPEKSCKGNPVPVPFKIKGFKGTKCEVCMEVLEYETT